MQTNLSEAAKRLAHAEEAERILRSCVHCGFCNATCPTYQELGDELDGPRGRIYLIKQFLEQDQVSEKTQEHLDRCLTCRNCETTCPSGVEYHKLLDIGRAAIEVRVPRPLGERLLRGGLRAIVPRPALFKALVNTGEALRPILPVALRSHLPRAIAPAGVRPAQRHKRRVLMLEGCVQPALSPNTNSATARVLDRLGISITAAAQAGCCGAIRYHLNDHEGGLDDARRNIDAWWPYLEAGAEAIVMTASGCGAMVKEYGHLLAHDKAYAEKAARISSMTKDLSEIMPAFEVELQKKLADKITKRVAFHPPCTLQHAQQIRGKVEGVLRAAGVDVTLCADSHLCCGSAGTYSVLQPELSYKLRDNKLANLQATGAEEIVSANIGCITHLQSGTDTPVRHWIELIDRALAQAA